MNSAPVIVIICEVFFGLGHLSRVSTLAIWLARRFRVVMILIGDVTTDVDVPKNIELVRFARPSYAHDPVGPSLSSSLVDLVVRLKPAVLLVEYFPFGRHFS